MPWVSEHQRAPVSLQSRNTPHGNTDEPIHAVPDVYVYMCMCVCVYVYVYVYVYFYVSSYMGNYIPIPFAFRRASFSALCLASLLVLSFISCLFFLPLDEDPPLFLSSANAAIIMGVDDDDDDDEDKGQM